MTHTGITDGVVEQTLSDAPPDLSRLAGGSARWLVQGLLGQGGGGEVWEVIDRMLGRRAALKVMLRCHSGQREREERFLGEARIAAALDHPAILPVYDAGRTADGRLCIIMRQAQGRGLHELIGDRGMEAPLDQRMDVAVRLSDAIAYAHACGIAHGDIKPGNVLLGGYGELTVLDWGSARFLDEPVQPGRVQGTPAYMSPEQARGEAPDCRSDVYCLGATLWHLFTGRVPIAADQADSGFWRRKQLGYADPLPEAGLPGSLATILKRAVDADPGRRYADAQALSAALHGCGRQREAEAVCDRADLQLAVLEGAGDHTGFARAVADYQYALSLAPDLARARAGRAQARLAHARFAFARGERALAARLLDAAEPTHAELRRELVQALPPTPG